MINLLYTVSATLTAVIIATSEREAEICFKSSFGEIKDSLLGNNSLRHSGSIRVRHRDDINPRIEVLFTGKGCFFRQIFIFFARILENQIGYKLKFCFKTRVNTSVDR